MSDLLHHISCQIENGYTSGIQPTWAFVDDAKHSTTKMGLAISNIINQDGDIVTDGEVIDQIADYLKSQGLFTERILTDREKEAMAFNEGMKNKKRKDCVIFFWQDKSGRGESCQMTLRAVLENLHGKNVKKWAKTADVGDVWENNSESYRRIS